ncbi:hypothetical protein N8I77_013670 [Diaporthe amygdali]|uniref:Uncharacterized protein n=1 Tax=Phomopsis amygdali TaxID=1214568 RepID=A0AAD9S0R8_PHOAM|nr:hypothetical protein N8I77_013670 [Diaporthe amygdali]
MPMAEEAIEYEFKNFHDEFSPMSSYRGPPTAEREAKWDSLAHCRPDYLILHCGRLLKHSGIVGLLRVARKHVTTSSRSVAEAEKRMAIGQRKDEVLVVPGIVLNKCIEVLREELMCSLDSTPYLIAEDPRAVRGFAPVIGNTHYCRNYERIAHWAGRNFVSLEEVKENSISVDI